MAYQLTYSLQHTLAQLPTAPESSSQQKQKAIAVVLPPSPPISPHSPFQIKATDRLTTKKPVESFPKNTTRNNTTDTVTAGIPGQISNETKSQAGTNSLQSPPLFTEPGQEDLHLRLRRPSEAETNGALALDPAATHDTGQSSPEQVNLEQSCSPVFPGGNHQLALTPTQGKNKADIDSVVNLVSENLANTERMEEERPVETFCSFPVRQVTNRKFKGMIDLLERSRYSELKAGSIPIQPESSDLSSTLLTQFWDGCSKNVQDLIDSHYYDKLMTEIIDYNRDHTLPESVIFSYLIPKDREKCHVMRHNDVYPKSVYTSSWLNTNNLLEIDEEFGLPWCLKYNQQSTPRVEQAEVVRTEDDEPGAASEMQEVMPQTESVIPGPEANVTVATPTHSCGETESPEIIECAEDDGCRQTETPEIIECAEDGSCRLTETSEIIECAEDHVPTNSPVSLVVGVQSPGEATRSFGEVQAQSERSADQQTKVLKEFDGNEIHEVYCCVPKMMAKMYGDTNFLCHCKSEPAPGKPTINVKSRGEVNIDLTGEEESYVNPATLLSKETEQQPILLSSDSSSKKGTVRRKRKRHLEGSYSPLSVQKKKRGDCNPRQIPLAIPQNANSKSDQSLTENSNQTVGHDLQHVSISRQVSLKDIRVQQCVAPESLKEQQLETTSTQRLTGKECLTSQPGSAVKLALFGSQVQQNTGQRSNPFTFRSQIPPPILNVNFGSSVRKGASLVTSMMRKSPEVKKPEFKNPEVRSSVKERLLTEWWGSYVPSKIQRRAPKKTKPFGAKPRWGTHRKSIGSYAVKATSAEILGCPPAAPNRSPRAGGSIQGILNGLKLRVAKISSS